MVTHLSSFTAILYLTLAALFHFLFSSSSLGSIHGCIWIAPHLPPRSFQLLRGRFLSFLEGLIFFLLYDPEVLFHNFCARFLQLSCTGWPNFDTFKGFKPCQPVVEKLKIFLKIILHHNMQVPPGTLVVSVRVKARYIHLCKKRYLYMYPVNSQ